MSRVRITKEAVEAVTPGLSEIYLWDTKLKGYGLKVTPSGRRVYFIQYRLGGRKGRTRRVTIGTHGIKTEHQARNEAKALLGAVQTGSDPAVQRDKLRDAETFGHALERFLTAHVDAKCRAYTAQEYKRVLRLHVPANLRSRNLIDVNRGDITRLHDTLRDKPFQANRVLAILSKFHSQPQTTQRYAHLAADPLKAATERVANALAGAMSGGKAAEIISLRNSGKSGLLRPSQKR